MQLAEQIRWDIEKELSLSNSPGVVPVKHPDQNLHSRPLLGLVNLWGFKYDEENDHWQDGHIYDPKNGKEYKCTISLKDKNTINVRGFIGISLIGRTDVWTRVK